MAKNFKKYFGLGFVLLLAAFIRFYNFNHVPYTHDELSALSRLDYENLSQVIDEGIRPDGHPALIHLFLYAWTKIGGTSEEWVKLPFVLFGLLSVFLTYRIGKKWFGDTAGLFASLLMACTQFFIIYSQYARPYISGCLLSLLLLDALLNILFESRVKRFTYVQFALALALCALDHHMCMLFAFLAALTGLFFLKRSNLVPYLVSCAAAVILYLPHISITLGQMSIGGVGGWLSPPSHDFLFRFVFFLFHYSFIALSVVAGIIILSIVSGKNERKESPKRNIRLFLMPLFILSWLIPHLYSVYKNPLLQYSTLIFSAPCFILFIFSFMQENVPVIKWSSLFIVAGILFFTLAKNRLFFQLNYRQGFEEFVLSVNHFQKKNPGKKVAAIVRAENWFIDFYKKKYGVNADFIFQPNDYFFKSTDLKQKLDSLKTDYLLVGNLEPQQFYQARNYYPKLLKYDFGYSYELMVFCKDCAESEVKGPRVKKSIEMKLKSTDIFYHNADKVTVDSVDNETLNALLVTVNDEYPVGTAIKLEEWKVREGNHFIAEVQVNNADSARGLLSVSVNKGDSTLSFGASDIQGYHKDGKKITNAILSSWVSPQMQKMKENEELKIFVWNKDHYAFKVYTFKLSLIDFNPYRYSLLDEIN